MDDTANQRKKIFPPIIILYYFSYNRIDWRSIYLCKIIYDDLGGVQTDCATHNECISAVHDTYL